MANMFLFLLMCVATNISVVLVSENKVCNEEKIITEEDVEKAFSDAEPLLNDTLDLICELAGKGRIISKLISDLSLNRQKNADVITSGREKVQQPFGIVSTLLYQNYNLTRDEITNMLPTISLNGKLSSAIKETCTRSITIDDCEPNSSYRTANGQCNNLEKTKTTWGSAMSCQRRLLYAHYSGVDHFRRSRNGGPLPEVRILSLNLHFNKNRPTNDVTHMYMFFGQLLDHDIILTPQSTTVNNAAIHCCPAEKEDHPQCRPIIVPNNDPFYSRYNVTCLNFVRSAACSTCALGARVQSNGVTSYIDLSITYGNSKNETDSLKANDGTGRLRSQESAGGELLPSSSDPQNDHCSIPKTNDICFEAGDPRVNQHPVLTSLQTLFMREHNRIATQLRSINPHWDDERLFQEARRIVGAIMQIITYKEYLPITLGDDRMTYFDLWTGQRTKYNPDIDPTMNLEFTTAAFRFGHSLINSIIANYPRNATNGLLLLRNEFFQPFDLRRGFVDPLLGGASNSPAQWFDRHVVPDVTNYLYRTRGEKTGLDLAAINIQRGRDHGIPTYVEMVRFCTNGEINVRYFDDLVIYGLMGPEQAEALRRNYRYVQDVDAWPGILMEIPIKHAIVGPTAACIIGTQFHNLKFGDRFYFEHCNQKGSFTNQQLNQLRRVRLSQVICLNTNVSLMARNAMLFNSRNNPLIICKNVKGINLSYWKE